MNTELTARDMRDLRGIAKSWIKDMPWVDVDDFLQDAIQEALTNVGKAPVKQTFFKHVIHYIVMLNRRLRYRENILENVPHLPLDAAFDAPATETPDDEYQERRELREFIVQTVLERMPERSRTLLVMCYYYGLAPFRIAKVLNKHHSTIQEAVQKAQRDFVLVAESLGLSVNQPNVEPGSKWVGKSRRLPNPVDAWYKTENETDPMAFVQADGVPCRSSGQESMQLRVHQLRAAGRSHSPDAQHGTEGAERTETPPLASL